MEAQWVRSTFAMPGMDCPTEEQLVRLALADIAEVADLQVDLAEREVTIVHQGPVDPLLTVLGTLAMGARFETSRPVAGLDPVLARGSAEGSAEGQRRVLVAVLVINAAMFAVELVAGILAQSTGLLADSLDMLADATVYAIALAAVGGAYAGQRRSARISGWLQLALAVLVLVEVAQKAVRGSEPQSGSMMIIGGLALAANLACVLLLSGHRQGGLHLRASWIFTTNDALANIGVIVAGLLVAVTGSAAPDLIIGAAIAALVASGALRILRMTGKPAPVGPMG